MSNLGEGITGLDRRVPNGIGSFPDDKEPPPLVLSAKYFVNSAARYHLSDEARGVYMMLLCYAWHWNGLPTCRTSVALAIGITPRRFERLWLEIAPFWKDTGEFLIPRHPDEVHWSDKELVTGSPYEHEGWRGVWTAYEKRLCRLHKSDCAKRAHRVAEARRKGAHTKDEWDEMLSVYAECLACGKKDGLSKDHVIPVAKGGSDSITNLQPLCRSCNSMKGSQVNDLRVNHPRTRPEWLPEEVE